jgi:serine/threonine-protein kinase
MIGSCEVVGSLLPGKPGSALLAFKLDPGGASETVLLHRLDEGAQPPAAAVAEAEEAAGLRDSHLERVFGIEVGELGSFWVTEYVPGATLDEIRSFSKHGGMPMPMGFGLAAVADAALGLQQLHARESARDPLRPRAHGLLRPQHVVATFGGSAKLLNPRYLKVPQHAQVEAEWFAGNAGYLAPEAIRGEPVDPRSDVFSLAVLVHELLTNKILFAGRNPRERADATLRGAQVPPSRLNLSLSPQVDAAVMRALSLQPSERYANAGDFHRALKQAVGPYMWKEAQRAEYMERIFATRSRRTQQLALLMKEREAAAIARAAEERRVAEQRRAEEAAAAAAAEEAARAQRQQQLAAEAARLREQQAAASSPKAGKPAGKSGARLPVPMLAIAAIPAVAIVVVVGWFVFRSPPAEPPPVVAAPPPPVIAPVEVADAGADAGAEEADAGSVDASDGGAEPAADAGPPKKKKKKNDALIPPWLRKR